MLYKEFMVYFIWLMGVIVWNFGVPNATPLEDVLVAIALSFLSMGLKKYFKM
jgi:predicted outer membrane lipoprotein